MDAFADIPLPDDFHLHLRRCDSTPAWARESALDFGRAMVMPNVVPPIDSGARMIEYRDEIAAAAPGFTPLMTFKLRDGFVPDSVRECVGAGAVAGKYYPAGATTNAEDGVSSPDAIADALKEMERLGVVLSVHAEDPAAFCMDREKAFLPVLGRILSAYPALKIVMEHASSRDAVEWAKAKPDRLGVTVTAHHLRFTLDDLMGNALDPHFHCKPCLKTPRDRDALKEAVLSGDKRFFFGSDSAPHLAAAKAGGKAASGCFSSTVALSLVAETFAEAFAFGGAEFVERLSAFVSRNGADFYGLPRNPGTVRITEREWTVPDLIGGAVPLLAGKTMRFLVERIS